MDDFNTSSLTESRNEYCALFVNKLTPYIMQGIQSIFDEAYKLCIDNEEDEKYLMTFQNFLGRITKWNQDLVNIETERIITESGCNYLEDLLTCAHITQLKILTSVRVGQKQKKIDINVPKLQDFIHKSYIEVARRIYKNVFLFEMDIMPLDKQRQMRELEILVKESIINVIRNSMPIEDILRAYVDETVEEDVYEINETITEVVNDVSATDVSATDVSATDESTNETGINDGDTRDEKVTEEAPSEIIVNKSQSLSSSDSDAIDKVDSVPLIPTRSLFQTESTESTESTDTPLVSSSDATSSTENIVISTAPAVPAVSTDSSQLLNFNSVDRVKTYNSSDIASTIEHTDESKLDAPKTIARLEQISEERNAQRKAEDAEEDDDEDSIKIHSNTPIHLGALDVHDLSSPIKLNTTTLLGDVTSLA